MRIHILGARVIDPASGLDQVRDIFLDAGKLLAFDQAPAGFIADQTIAAQGLIAAPGLVDLSVALREPGYSRKGNISSETLAAAAGGVTSLCCPPQTRPVLDTPAVTELIVDRAREAGHAKVYPIGALSVAAPSVICSADELREKALQHLKHAAADISKAMQTSGSALAT